ncbi:MAG TPA: MFS transporter, partial [Asanoa sp.]|nr:MFS transporter [Asanoa sp.]
SSEPVLPLWVFRRRLLLSSGVVSAGAGAVLLGLSSYVPTYAQVVIGVGPLVAGLALAALTLGWPIAASQSGRLYLRFGFRACAMTGSAIIVVGAALLLLLDGDTSVWQVGATSLVIGFGMGLTVSPTLIASQSSVGWQERGVVTANNMFLRSMGSALGTAVFGAVANATLRGSDADPAKLVPAVHHVFIGVLAVAVVIAVAAALLPRRAAPVVEPRF